MEHLPVEDRMKAAVNSVKPSPQFSDELWRKMQSNQAAAPVRFSFSRPFKIAALSLAMLGLLIIAIGPQRVWASVNQLIGYLPGIGFFRNDGQTLYLAQPVSTEVDGVSLTVKQAVADKDLVVIDYEITGLKAKQSSETFTCMYDSNELLLPDGSKMHVTGGNSTGDGDGIQARVEFQALKGSVKQVTLVAGRQDQDPSCKAPAELKAELALVPAPAGLSAAQVSEFPTDQADSKPIVSNAAGGIQFTIDRIADLPQGYVISSHATGDNREWQNIWPEFDKMKITDASGAQVDFQPSNDVSGENEFGIQINRKDIQFPLKISVGSVLVTGSPEELPSFSFDAGTNPQIGQEWPINQVVDVLGQKVTVEKARALADEANAEHDQGYEFTVSYDNNVQFLNLGLKDPGEYAEGSGSDRPNGDHGRLIETYFTKGLPSGHLTFEVHTIQFRVENSWNLEINSVP
jgi:hypothetical protein